MRYDEFRARYDHVMVACLTGKLSIEGLAERVDELNQAIETVDWGDRRLAARDVATLQEILDTAAKAPHLTSAHFAEASRAFSIAIAEHGTDADRVARARAGIAQLHDMADQATSAQERSAILDLTEPLERVVAALAPGA